MISVPRPTVTTPSIATRRDCTGNVHCDPSTLIIVQPALMALPTTHCTLCILLTILITYVYYSMIISVSKPTMTTPSIATRHDCTGNFHCDPSTLIIMQPALMALPTTHCTLHKIKAYNGQYTKGT